MQSTLVKCTVTTVGFISYLSYSAYIYVTRAHTHTRTHAHTQTNTHTSESHTRARNLRAYRSIRTHPVTDKSQLHLASCTLSIAYAALSVKKHDPRT